ncbi:MAG: hypothetical protein R3233_05020 [Xanthomonadales bacterium]|nr:hypothetical protein [Xanthomonadales bacterium]
MAGLLLYAQQATAKPSEPPYEDVNESAWISLLTPKKIFVTSAEYNGNLVLEAQLLGATESNPLAAADYICNHHAAAAGLKGRFVAILSTSGVNANARLSTSLGPYQLVTGTPVAASFAALFGTDPGSETSAVPRAATLLTAPVFRDEFGVDWTHPANSIIPTSVWTGSDARGDVESFARGLDRDLVYPGASTCFDWTTSDDTVGLSGCTDPEVDYNCGVIGNLESRATGWIDSERGSCMGSRRLYCAEQ